MDLLISGVLGHCEKRDGNYGYKFHLTYENNQPINDLFIKINNFFTIDSITNDVTEIDEKYVQLFEVAPTNSYDRVFYLVVNNQSEIIEHIEKNYTLELFIKDNICGILMMDTVRMRGKKIENILNRRKNNAIL